MEAGASAGARDESGMSALTLMVTKMPSVVSRERYNGECGMTQKVYWYAAII